MAEWTSIMVASKMQQIKIELQAYQLTHTCNVQQKLLIQLFHLIIYIQ